MRFPLFFFKVLFFLLLLTWPFETILQAAKARDRNTPPSHKTFRFRLPFELSTLDWNVGDVVPILVLRNAMRGLFTFDENGKVVPDLIKSFNSKENGKIWTFRLKEDVRWSDGVLLNATHAAESLRRLLDPKTASSYAYFLYDVEGANTNQSPGIKVLSENSFEVRLKNPVSYFPAILTHWVTYPIRPDLIAKYKDFWSNPSRLVTLGAFRITEWKPTQRILLTPNPYAQPKPWFEKVEALVIPDDSTALNLYETGYLDMMTDPGPATDQSPDVIHRPSQIQYFIGIGTGHPLAATRPGILALSAALNRLEIPAALNAPHRPALDYCPPELWNALGMTSPKVYPKNIPLKGSDHAAREYLKQAGFHSGKDVPPLTLKYFNRPSIKELAEWIQDRWKRILGLTVYIEGRDPKTYWSELSRNPSPFFINSKGASYPDADVFFRLFEGSNPQNLGRWGDAQFDQWIQAARKTANPAKRGQLYSHALKRLLNEKPALIPLYFRDTQYLIKPYVKGIRIDSLTNVYFTEAHY